MASKEISTPSQSFNVQKALNRNVSRTRKGPLNLVQFACRFRFTSYLETMTKYQEVVDAAAGGGYNDLAAKMQVIMDSKDQKQRLTQYIEENASPTEGKKKPKTVFEKLGNGDPSCAVAEHYVLKIGDDEVNVTKVLMDAREVLVNGEWAFEDFSDLLVMNFIFIEKFLKRHLDGPFVNQLCRKTLTSASLDDAVIIGKLGADASLSKTEFMKTFNEIADGWEHPLCRIIQNLVQEPNFWGLNGRNFAERTYQTKFANHIIKGILHELPYCDHFNTAALPVPLGHKEDLKPDFFGVFEEDDETNLPFIVAEVNKPKVDGYVNKKDMLKIYCEMKLMVDVLRQNGVKDPEVIGLLFQNRKCIVYTMKPEHEAMYIPVLWGGFPVPESNVEIGSMSSSLPILEGLKEVARTTLKKIAERVRNQSIPDDTMIRRSYYLHSQLS
ncbi:hypothetical protein BGX31_001929 [Mortierella sp. GBA43]|nr:hypothetical protein BGX31_001929 [Mortierella sp. GBA43]